MSNTKIRALLDQLRTEIEKTGLDAQTKTLIKEFDDDIHDIIGTIDAPEKSVLERARQLEGKFAASHPNAERLVTEVINTLSKMGI